MGGLKSLVDFPPNPSPVQILLKTKKDLAEAKEYHDANRIVLWYRREYNLPPNDPRFLSMTYDDIKFEWNLFQVHQEEQEEFRLSKLPSCRECDYRGNPDPDYLPTHTICPECGAEMMIPGTNQTMYADDNIDAALATIGLTENDIK